MRLATAFVRTTLVIALVGFLSCPHAVSAQDLSSAPLIKQGDETLVIDLGGIVNQFGTTVRLNGQSQNGTDLDLERNGLKKQAGSFQAAASWRFLSRNRIDLEYFSNTRTGSHTYDTQITIGDNVYPLGATVSAKAKDQFLLGDYRYSFVKNDDVEVAGLLGIYGGRFTFDLSASGNAGNLGGTTNTNASTTVPLPLIGGTVDWYINPRWKIAAGVEGLKARIGNVDGSAIVAMAATDYTLFRNLGVGVRYMYSDVSADVTKTHFDGTVKWRMNSVSLYAKLMF